MSSTPPFPPAGPQPVRPHWRSNEDWITLLEFLRDDDKEDRLRGAEAIGYMLAYARITDTRMLAMVGSAKDGAYELLFSFNSAANKAKFLRLLQNNDATACEDDEILVPQQAEIQAARPIAKVLPEDVLLRVFGIAETLSDGHKPEGLQ
jgi:hypothetical protein